MHHHTDIIAHVTGLVTPVVVHWLDRKNSIGAFSSKKINQHEHNLQFAVIVVA